MYQNEEAILVEDFNEGESDESELKDIMTTIEDWYSSDLKRQFTVRSDEVDPVEMLQLSKLDLYKMRLEFYDAYQELFTEGDSLL